MENIEFRKPYNLSQIIYVISKDILSSQIYTLPDRNGTALSRVFTPYFILGEQYLNLM